MKTFKSIQEERGEKAYKQAIGMGLKYGGFGYWKDPQTNETVYKTENDTLVPVEPREESELAAKGGPDSGGGRPDPMAGGLAGGGGMTGAGGMLKMPGGGMGLAGAGIQGAPEPGMEKVDKDRSWEPGPDGNTCVGPESDKAATIPKDSFVGRTNFMKWVAGPDGDNMNTISLGEIREQIFESQTTDPLEDSDASFPKTSDYEPPPRMKGNPKQEARRAAITKRMNDQFKNLKMVSKPDLDMDKIYENGRVLGEGIQGKVVKDNDSDTVVKKGNIGTHELEALHRMRENPSFPTMLNARFDGPFANIDPVRNNPKGGDTRIDKWYQDHNYGENFYEKYPGAPGMFAMTAAKGQELNDIPFADDDEEQFAMVKRLHQLRRDMHKQGIAHNDMHGGNVFYDEDSGEMSMLDLGLANVSPIRALMEALGGINGASPMDVVMNDLDRNEAGDYQLGDEFKGFGMRDSEHEGLQGLGGMFERNSDNIRQHLLDRYAEIYDLDDDNMENEQFDYQDAIETFMKGGIRMNLDDVRDRTRLIEPLLRQLDDGEEGGELIDDDNRVIDDNQVMKLMDMLYDGLEETPMASSATAPQRMARAYDKIVDNLGSKRQGYQGKAVVDIIRKANELRKEKGEKPISIKGLDISKKNDAPSRIPSRRRAFDKIVDMDD